MAIGGFKEGCVSAKSATKLRLLPILLIFYLSLPRDSLRARFGTDLRANALHCSATVEEARSEIEALLPNFTFPKTSRKKTKRFVIIVVLKSLNDEAKGGWACACACASG